MLTAGCTEVVEGSALAAEKGPLRQAPITVSALEGLLLDSSQINSELSATSMKVWFNAKVMWDWSSSVTDNDCLAVDGPAQEKVYANTGWTAMRGQRLDDSVNDSKKRQHYAIQAIVAFSTAQDANTFYTNQVQSWKNCSNRRFSDVAPNQPDTIWTVASAVTDNGTLSTSQVQEGGDGWTCQRALTVRNNISIDIVTCAYNQMGSAAKDIALQIAAKAAKQ
ncbi:sensor domain-containing protein [Mycobacterium sp. 1423905.2]|uniref:sensor domain-containing protein n=1 Tax=Mycobacterium sp. 1423905.2 TaxID=1856859 RepID=UPI0012EA701E|nr:sensor domain-containing protein [Mycobacterium sp. 1423905.2]